MKVLIFGDANVDLTVNRSDVEKNLDRLSESNRAIIRKALRESEKTKIDIEVYIPKYNKELAGFFQSLNPRIRAGGCGAIKAMTMSALGHDVVFYSWVGADDNGKIVLESLSRAGVDTSKIKVSGRTCETYNIFDRDMPRLAFSFWEQKIDFKKIVAVVNKEKPDTVLLTGAHRTKLPMGYGRLRDAYVFTGSFFSYSKKELANKYKADFSRGILVGNDVEIMQLARVSNLQLTSANDPVNAMKKLENEIIVMHGPKITAVKRGDEIITAKTIPIEKNKIIELTGIGDVWEAVFVSEMGDIKSSSRDIVIGSMMAATKAAGKRMTGS